MKESEDYRDKVKEGESKGARDRKRKNTKERKINKQKESK